MYGNGSLYLTKYFYSKNRPRPILSKVLLDGLDGVGSLARKKEKRAYSVNIGVER